MTNILAGSDQIVFRRKAEVADYVLQHILANTSRKVGAEWEMFLVNQANGKALSRDDGQRVLFAIAQSFIKRNYKTALSYEPCPEGSHTISGINIEGLGTVTPEIGHQIEFSCAVGNTAEELTQKNKIFYEVIHQVATQAGYTPLFMGHVDGYAATTNGSYRSRSTQWHDYFGKRYGDLAPDVCETLDATAASQITLDAGAHKFHEFFKTLLLIEPALTLYYANSKRPHLGTRALPLSHIAPATKLWNAKTAQEATDLLVDRLMDVEVPFLPDPENALLYKAEPLISGLPPTIGSLMEQSRLNEMTLNNAGGFLLSRPAVRRFSQGLIEMRGVDAQASPEDVEDVAKRVCALVYNDRIRESLLEDYADLNELDISRLHQASMQPDRTRSLNTKIAGRTITDIIDDIIDRSSETSNVRLPMRRNFVREEGAAA